MKFYTSGEHINKVEYYGFTTLHSALIRWHSGKSIELPADGSGEGIIFEGEEGCECFCKLAYNFEPIPITDQEYNQLLLDGIAFFDKNKSKINKKILKPQHMKR